MPRHETIRWPLSSRSSCWSGAGTALCHKVDRLTGARGVGSLLITIMMVAKTPLQLPLKFRLNCAVSVSIVIPTKDRPVGLARAVSSAKAALPNDGEIIVVDDGSKVPATRVIREGEGVRLVRNEGMRSGPSAARNFGVGLAEHPLILFLDDDDQVLPTYPQRIIQVATMEMDAGYGICARIRRKPGSKDKIDSRRGRLGYRDTSTPLISRLTGTGGLWVRRDVFVDVGGLDEHLLIHEDIELCMRLAKAGIGMFFDNVRGYVVHARARTSDAERIMVGASVEDRLASFRRILAKHGDLLASEAPGLRRKYQLRILKLRVQVGI